MKADRLTVLNARRPTSLLVIHPCVNQANTVCRWLRSPFFSGFSTIFEVESQVLVGNIPGRPERLDLAVVEQHGPVAVGLNCCHLMRDQNDCLSFASHLPERVG